MLEFNNKHKKVNSEYINKKSENHRKIGKAMVSGILISSVIFFSGCGKKVSKDSTTDCNRAIISIGNDCVVVEINRYTFWTVSHADLCLTDGTKLTVHPENLYLYNNKSNAMQNAENSISPIYINSVYSNIEDNNVDRALVKVGDDLIELDLSTYTIWDDGHADLKLTDGTVLKVHPMDFILFNSQSPVMNQVQEEVLGETKSLTR